eukprot:COSAG02_NODE_8010_length_2747_cov_1.387085_2_plen_80_part_00
MDNLTFNHDCECPIHSESYCQHYLRRHGRSSLHSHGSDELQSVQGEVAVETATPELVCAQQMIAPRETGVDIEVECKQA